MTVVSFNSFIHHPPSLFTTQAKLDPSLCFNGHCPGGPGLDGTRMSPFWILLELRVIEEVMITTPIRYAKLQSNHHQQQTNIQRFTGQMPYL